MVRPADSPRGHLSLRMLVRTLTDLPACSHRDLIGRSTSVPVLRTRIQLQPSLTVFRQLARAGYAASERLGRPAGHPAGCMIGACPRSAGAPPSGRGRALATVVAAFAADPLLRWVWPDDERYAACAPRLLRPARSTCGWRAARSGSADGGAAVAMWDPPGGLYRTPPASAGRRSSRASASASATAGQTYDDAMGVPQGRRAALVPGGAGHRAGARQGTGLGRAVTAPCWPPRTAPGCRRTWRRRARPTWRSTGGSGSRRSGRRRCRTTDRRCWLMRRDPREVVAQ